MFCSHIIRRLHISSQKWTSNASPASALATLRKKTGYTFANCKKALQINNNDLLKAESWLREQAQAMGWSKATKLEGRQTSQGLIGVLTRKNVAAMVELNCETDFVARNEHFQAMVDAAANACVAATETKMLETPFMQFHFDSDAMKALKLNDGKSLADHLALMIGTVGENATLRRAVCFKSDDSVHLATYAHPSGVTRRETHLGKFGGIAAITNSNKNVVEVGKNICQHIVGLKPMKVGTDDDVPAKEADDESCLIHQEYLLDESLLVGDVLKENDLLVVDFKRFECGEEICPYVERPLDTIETCQ